MYGRGEGWGTFGFVTLLIEYSTVLCFVRLSNFFIYSYFSVFLDCAESNLSSRVHRCGVGGGGLLSRVLAAGGCPISE